MPAFISFGRFLFCILFVYSGAAKLLDLAGTTQLATKVVVPTIAAPYVTQLEGWASGMPFAQMVAIAGGATQLVCGLLIALNFGVRFFAMILVVYLVAVNFYFHDFWNQSGAEAQFNLMIALKNLSLIGALFVLAGIGRGPRTVETAYTEV